MNDTAGGKVFRLIYRSHDLLPPIGRKAALGALFTDARSNNKKKDITGALMLSEDWFVQTLEGDEREVRTLFDHIEHDPRHDGVTVLEAGFVEERVFPRWSMAQVSEQGGGDTYLIAHADGISPASSRGTTPDQEIVLDAMRSALGAARTT